jgi:Raf kinase inhibitor-like YbhB/YbcL family protein
VTTVTAALAGAFALSSPVLQNGGTIPARYTCDGKGASPPLRWTAPPAGTRSIELLVADPDAGTGLFIQWLAVRIPVRAGAIGENGHVGHEQPNTAGTPGWTPPCPPRGPSHQYLFIMKALDARGRSLAEADLILHYRRR